MHKMSIKNVTEPQMQTKASQAPKTGPAAGSTIKARRTRQEHKCPYEGCTASFIRPVRLRSHIMLHEGTQPYKCTWPTCGRAFAEKSNMTIHMRIHNKEHLYSCSQPGCSKTFTTKGNM